MTAGADRYDRRASGGPMQIASSASCAGRLSRSASLYATTASTPSVRQARRIAQRDLAAVRDEDPPEHQRASARGGELDADELLAVLDRRARLDQRRRRRSRRRARARPGARRARSPSRGCRRHGRACPTRRASRAVKMPTAGDVAIAPGAFSRSPRAARSVRGAGSAAAGSAEPRLRPARCPRARLARGRGPRGRAGRATACRWRGGPPRDAVPNGRRSRTCQSPSRTSSSPRCVVPSLAIRAGRSSSVEARDARVVRCRVASALRGALPAPVVRSRWRPASGTDQTSSWAGGSSRLDEPGAGMPIDQRVGSSRSRRRSAIPRLGGGATSGAADLSVRAERAVAPVSRLHELVRRERGEPVQLADDHAPQALGGLARIGVRALARLRHDPVDHAELELVLRGHRIASAAVGRLVGGPPQDRGAALRADHRVDGVLERDRPRRRRRSRARRRSRPRP